MKTWKIVLILLLPGVVSVISILESHTLYAQSATDDDPAERSRGYLKITTVDLDSFYVVLNSNFNETIHIASGDSISVDAGQQFVRIVKKFYIDDIYHRVIRADSVYYLKTRLIPMRNPHHSKTFSTYPRIHWGGNFVVVTDHDSKLYMGDEYLGTGMAVFNTSARKEIIAVSPDGAVTRRSFKPQKETFEVGSIFHRPSARESRAYAFIPGASQIYKRQYLKGAAIIGGMVITSLLTWDFDRRYHERYREYQGTRELYLAETNPFRMMELGDRAEKLFDESKNLSNIRNALLIGTIAAYVYNIIDGFLPPRIGFRDEKLIIDPYLDFHAEQVRANLSIRKQL